MQITQLEYLIAVEKYGSISHAARELYTSQSSISTSIKALENELDVALLKRGSKGVKLTAEGEYILENAKRVLENINNIRDVKEAVEGKICGSLAVAATGHCCMIILGHATVAMREAYPDVEVRLTDLGPKQIMQGLIDGNLNMGLFQVNAFNEKSLKTQLEYFKLSWQEVYRSRLVVAVTNSHPLYGREEISLRDLLDYEIVTGFVRAENLVYWDLFQQMERLGYKKSIVCLGDVMVARFYALRRKAVLLMPEFAMALTNDLYSIPISPITIRDADYPVSCLMVTRAAERGAADALFAETVLDFLAQRGAQA